MCFPTSRSSTKIYPQSIIKKSRKHMLRFFPVPKSIYALCQQLLRFLRHAYASMPQFLLKNTKSPLLKLSLRINVPTDKVHTIRDTWQL